MVSAHDTLSGAPPLRPRGFALLMIGLGLAGLLLATIQYARDMRQLRAEYGPIPRSYGSVLAALIAGCATTDGLVSSGVDVTRFHLGQEPARGTISIEPVDAAQANSFEFNRFANAVERELTRLGWTLREVRSLTAQARLSGTILGLLPIGFFLFLSVVSHHDMAAAYSSSIGVAAIAAGLVLDGLAFLWIRKLVAVEA